MRILFLGDIVGKSGRDIVSSLLYDLKKKYQTDLVIVNAENAAHGKGITYKIYKQLMNEGIDYITMGNHTFSKAEIYDHIDDMDRLVVPYNHSKRTTDNYYKLISYKGMKICLTNIMGSVLMPEADSDPYTAFKAVMEKTQQLEPDFYFVDLHAETTAEKRIFLEYFKDKAKIVIGTHTHVQTADEAIIHRCAFITDAGMCGAYCSIIGRDIEESIKAGIDKEKTIYKIASGTGILCGVVIEIDDKKKIPVDIQRIQIRPE